MGRCAGTSQTFSPEPCSALAPSRPARGARAPGCAAPPRTPPTRLSPPVLCHRCSARWSLGPGPHPPHAAPPRRGLSSKRRCTGVASRHPAPTLELTQTPAPCLGAGPFRIGGSCAVGYGQDLELLAKEDSGPLGSGPVQPANALSLGSPFKQLCWGALADVGPTVLSPARSNDARNSVPT